MAGRCCHSISDVVKTALLTYLCGGEDYDDMSAYVTWNHRLVGQEALTYKDNKIQNTDAAGTKVDIANIIISKRAPGHRE